jgi:hypothetical protein
MTYTRCPECKRPAKIIDRFWLGSTDGGLEHLKIVCLGGHWFTPMAQEVETFSGPVPQSAPADAARALRSAA